jgi:uncharacterized protein YndB with AHSA1/START domain
MKISTATRLKAPVTRVWAARNTPQNLTRWNTQGKDSAAIESTVELHEAGRLLARMEAIDGSMGLDFEVFPRSF